MAIIVPHKLSEVFKRQPFAVQEAIKAKCTWEHMSLSAVIHDYWPELWKEAEQSDSAGAP